MTKEPEYPINEAIFGRAFRDLPDGVNEEAVKKSIRASTDPDFIRRQLHQNNALVGRVDAPIARQYGEALALQAGAATGLLRKTKMVDLTEIWFRSALQPRYQDDGSILRTLTPPRRPHGAPAGLILAAIFALSTVAFFYGMLR